MKGLLTTIGLAIALSLGAQTVPEEKEKQPAQQEGKAKVEQTAKPAREKASTGPEVKQSERTKEEGIKAREKSEKSRTSESAGAQVTQKGGGQVSHSTTVFRNGRQTNERLDLRRTTREQSDVHFTIGSHDRAWWLRTYTIVFIDGCHYYLADDGCWYPAFGFDPSCDYPPGVCYCD